MISMQNKGLIDIDLITTMGAHVKSGDDSIGYFGTGLKYAIATFLREGIGFYMLVGDIKYEFFTEPKTIRGKEFNICHMVGPYDSIALGFTTELGKNWQVWQAYREVYSNCLDEGGTIAHGERLTAKADYTTFVIVDEIDHDGVFLRELDKELVYSDDEIDIYSGVSDVIYYRGIRAKDLSKPSAYTYNIKERCQLTEDRLLCYDFQVEAIITNAVATMDNKDVIKTVAAAPKTNYESSIRYGDYISRPPNQPFIDVVNGERQVNPTISGYIKEHTPKQARTPEQRKEDFLSNLQELCDEYGASFVYERVVVISGGALDN